MHAFGRHCLSWLVWLLIAAPAVAEDAKVETVLNGLHHPSGVAVQPGGLSTRFQLFVSDTAAGRVIRLGSDASDGGIEVITGFPTTPIAKGPFGPLGPRGLLFVDDDQLVVAATGINGEAIRAYNVPEAGQVLRADQSRQQLKLDIRGSCYAMARTRANEYVPDLLVVSFAAVGGRDVLLECRVQADFLGDLKLFGNEDAVLQLNAPMAVTVSASGYVVVGQAGALNASRDSKIAIHNPADGAMIVSFDAELHDVVGLAYSPATGNLYSVDFASAVPDDGGVYRIDDASSPGHPACRAVKVADVRHPTALAFGPDGALYVTAFGEADDDGALVKITGGL
jgi:DNA-binding beta-propeller fold protein YncE